MKPQISNLIALALIYGGSFVGSATSAGTNAEIILPEPRQETRQNQNANPDVLTNDSIVKLIKAGLSEDVIVSMIKTQPAKFDVGVQAVLWMKSEGVSDKILNEMVLHGRESFFAPGTNPSETVKTKDGMQTITSKNEESKSSVTNRPKEPEYIGVFFRLNPKNGDLIPLERQNTQMRTSAGGFIAVGGDTRAQIEGAKSPVRFTHDENLSFIVRLNSQQDDPQTQIEFVRFESVKGKRQWILVKASAAPFAGTSTKDTSQNNLISFDAEKYGESSFKIIPARNLPPGEYVVGVKGVAVSYCFGVDGGGSIFSKLGGSTNNIGDPMVEKICESLDQADKGKVIDALKKLRKFKSFESVPRILPCLENSNPDVIREACRTLVIIGDPSAAPAVTPLLTHERPEIVREACRTLAIIGSKDTIPSIEPLLTSSRSDIRDEAYKTIKKLRSGS